MTTLADLLAAYWTCAKVEAKSPKTIRAVTQAVQYFGQFVGDTTVDKLTADDLKRFILSLQQKTKYSNHRFTPAQDKRLSPDSIASYVRSIKSFFSLLAREEIIPSNPMEKVKLPKTPKRVMQTYTEKELEKLFAQPDKKIEIGFRDYCIMLTLLDTGIRVSELCGLNIGDVDLNNGYLKVMGKGAKERLVPLGIKAIKQLLKYRLRYRSEADHSHPFFINRNSERLVMRRVEAQITRYGEMAKLKGVRVSPHTFRSSSAVLYLRNGGDTFSLQKKLGHSTLEMTRRYATLADTDVRDKHLKYGVADRLKI